MVEREMKKLLIIYPHWIPCNLVGVQRARLTANFLTDLGWQPIILAVKPEYYEETLVPELELTVDKRVKVYWTEAKKAPKHFRLFGDIALKAYRQLIDGAVEVIEKEKIDFIWTPLPSFYTSLVCRKVHDLTGVPYGLDYTDPWVHDFPGARLGNRAWLAKRLAQLLEPVAVKKVSLLTGVSELSYSPVIQRNPHLKGIVTGFMPLGFDPGDYEIELPDRKMMWEGSTDELLPVIYAGAFLPQAHYYIDVLMQVLAELRGENRLDQRLRFFFVGTGKGNLKTVADYAQKYGVSDIIQEKTERISYLDVLHHLGRSYGVLAVGNIEPHYTASKIFQTLLSGQRVFPIFHRQSTVNEILRECRADNFLVSYDDSMSERDFKNHFKSQLIRFLSADEKWNPDLAYLDKYSAKQSAKILVELIEKALEK